MEETASSLDFDITKFPKWANDLIEDPLVASEFLVPYLRWWMPISAFGYLGVFYKLFVSQLKLYSYKVHSVQSAECKVQL